MGVGSSGSLWPGAWRCFGFCLRGFLGLGWFDLCGAGCVVCVFCALFVFYLLRYLLGVFITRSMRGVILACCACVCGSVCTLGVTVGAGAGPFPWCTGGGVGSRGCRLLVVVGVGRRGCLLLGA